MRTAAAALMLSGAIATGCSLEQAYPDQHYYVLDSVRTEAPATPRSERILRVDRARVVAPFGTRAMQHRTGEHRFEADYYNNWADDPGALITAVAIETLGGEGLYRVVVDDSSGVIATHELELVVESLYIDATGAPDAVIAVRAVLTDNDGAVLMTGRYESSTPSTSAAADDLIVAWNQSLDAVLAQLAADLAGR